MGLSWQQGPLSPGAIGRFLVPVPLPHRILYVEPLRRRMRVRFGGTWIADSESVLLLFEPGRYPVAYFPQSDIRREVLERNGHTTQHADLGRTSWYTVRANGQHATRAAWEHVDLPSYAGELQDRIAFAWRAMDAFYEEDERVLGHAADSYHRIDIRQACRNLVVRHQDRVIADTKGPIRGELGALRWMDCDFDNHTFDIQHSYYWRRGGHLVDTKSEASAQPLAMHPGLKDGLLEWRSHSLYNRPEDFVFASEKLKGRKPLDLAAVLKKKIQPAFKSIGICGVGWHTFRHTVGTMLAEMGEHQLTIRDYLRHSNLHVTNKYLQATSKTKRLAHDKLIDAFLPAGLLPRPNLIQ